VTEAERHDGMTWSLPEPMLTVPVDSPALPPRWAAEPKWDGYRARLATHTDGRVLLRSRQGTDMTGSFPEIRAAALAQLPADTGWWLAEPPVLVDLRG
jgi:ATP-dependent DNA ligase